MKNDPDNQSQALEITGSNQPEVAVHTCTVYVSVQADGRVRAVVANCAGIEHTAASERDALSRVTKVFKQLLLDKSTAGEPVELIDTPDPPTANEKVRSIPVHL